jgi:hypothetical protein
MLMLGGLAAFFAFSGSTGLVRWLIVAFVLFGLWRGLGRAGFARRQQIRTWLVVAISLLAWSLLVQQLALAGILQARPGALPLLPIAIFAPLLIGLLLITRSRRMAAVVDAMPPTWLIGLQVYRVFGAAFLVQFGLGNLSAVLALPAGSGDVLVGILALPVAFYLGRDEQRGRTIAVAWNILGILDLAMAITVGFLITTGRLATLGMTPAASGLAYPLVMIPAFAVPLSLILHGVSLWQLKRRTARITGSQDVRAGGAAATPA